MTYLGTNLTNLLEIGTNGLLVQSAKDVFAARSIAVTGISSLTITNASGVGGNPTINLSLVSSDITTALGFTPLSSASLAAPPPIGLTTANNGNFLTTNIYTALNVLGSVSGSGFTNYLTTPPPIGFATANTANFTTLSALTSLVASGSVSGTGFTSLFASPPAIGSTTASTGVFSSLTVNGVATFETFVNVAGTGNLFGANTTYTSNYQYVNTNFAWYLRNDFTSGQVISLNVAPSGTAGATMTAIQAMAVSSTGLVTMGVGLTGTPIGATGASTGAFSSLTASANITLGTNTGTTAEAFYLNAAAGTTRSILFQSGGLNRWDIYVTGAETGSNAGCNLNIRPLSDTGAGLGGGVAPTFSIQRATGAVACGPISNVSIVTNSISSSGNILASGGITVTGSSGITSVPSITTNTSLIAPYLSFNGGQLSSSGSQISLQSTGMVETGVSVASGGTGYNPGDLVYDGSSITYEVTATSGGVVTGLTVYQALTDVTPSAGLTYPLTLTTETGSGTGLSINATFVSATVVALNPTSGTATAPTPATSDSSTNIATTAYVRNLFASPPEIGSSTLSQAQFTNIYFTGAPTSTLWQNQGGVIGWNYTGSTGEVAFVCSKGGGSGGFRFYTTISTSGSTPVLNAYLSGTGNLITYGGIDNTVIGATTPASGAFTTVTLASNPTTALQAATKQYVDAAAGAQSLANIAALRASTASTSPVWVNGFATGIDGGGGMFFKNTADTTSADNTGTIIVDASGNRWYREGHSNDLNILWFGGNALSDYASALNHALAALTAPGGRILFPGGSYPFASQITYTFPSSAFTVTLEGSGAEATTLYWASGGGLQFTGTLITHSIHVLNLSIVTGNTGVGNGLAFTLPANGGLGSQNDLIGVTVRGLASGVTSGTGSNTYWATAVDTVGVSNINMVDCLFFGGVSSGYAGNGVIVAGNASGSFKYAIVINLVGCGFYTLGIGFQYGTYVQGVAMTDCNITNVVSGVYSGTGAIGQTQLSMVGCQVNCQGNDIFLQSAIASVVLTGCLLYVPASGTGLYLGAAGGQHSVVNNIFSSLGGTTQGIVVAAGNPGAVCSGNVFYGLTTGVNTTSTTGWNVQGNSYVGCTNTVVGTTGNSVGVATQ